MSQQNVHVLYVEDDPDDIILMREELAEASFAGFNLQNVTNVASALDYLGNYQTDIILLDLNLPDSHGLETVSTLREHHPELPVVVYSGRDDYDLAVQIIQEGAQDFLVKGRVDANGLSRALRFAMMRHRAHRIPPESEAQLRSLISGIADGVLVISQEGLIVFANPTAEVLFGRPAAKLVDSFFGFPLTDHGASQVEILQSGGRVIHGEMRTALIEWKGKPAYLVSLRDMSERRQAELALEAAKQQLEVNARELQAANLSLQKSGHLKDQFLSTMSHELRTPLTGILGLADVLQTQNCGALNEKQQTALQHISESGRRLIGLINDILDYSSIEAGQLKLAPALCQISQICASCLRSVAGQANQKKLHTSLKVEPPDLLVKADGRRLKQMLVNLLSNAIKFTPAGGSCGIEVTASADERLVYISVWDTGIGIKAEDTMHLFQPFVQLDGRLAREYNGTGLGLVLAQRLAGLHGGWVDVHSEVGKGSRFTICLPWPN